MDQLKLELLLANHCPPRREVEEVSAGSKMQAIFISQGVSNLEPDVRFKFNRLESSTEACAEGVIKNKLHN